MIITIAGYDKSNPSGCITLGIEEILPEKRSCAHNYPAGSMQVKMVIDGRSFYEGVLQHHVRNENDKETVAGTAVI
jgi:hypothetical protein